MCQYLDGDTTFSSGERRQQLSRTGGIPKLHRALKIGKENFTTALCTSTLMTKMREDLPFLHVWLKSPNICCLESAKYQAGAISLLSQVSAGVTQTVFICPEFCCISTSCFSCTLALRGFLFSISCELYNLPSLDLHLQGWMSSSCFFVLKFLDCTMRTTGLRGVFVRAIRAAQRLQGWKSESGTPQSVGQENLLKHIPIFNNNCSGGFPCMRTCKESSVMSHFLSRSQTSTWWLLFWMLMFAIYKFGSEGGRVRLGQLKA